MSRAAPLLACALLALAACGPVTRAEAERGCAERAYAATGPHGEVRMGVVAQNGAIRPAGGVSVSISSDALAGADPDKLYAQCVLRRSGEMPSRPWREIAR